MDSSYTNFLFRRYTSTPPNPPCQGGSKKVSVASIEEIGIIYVDVHAELLCGSLVRKFTLLVRLLKGVAVAFTESQLSGFECWELWMHLVMSVKV